MNIAPAIRLVSGAIALSILLASCGGSLRPPAAGPEVTESMPRFLDIDASPHASTLHFPRGTYSLGAADKIGYYYRAPRPVLQQTGLGTYPREGGIFVSKRDPRKLRGYVYLAGGVTHVGSFGRVPHQFHN